MLHRSSVGEMNPLEVPDGSVLHAWVRGRFGIDTAPAAGLTVRNTGFNFDSLLLCRPGSEPGNFDAAQFSAARWIETPDGDCVFGTAPVERGAGEELCLRLADGRIAWTAELDHGPRLPRRPLLPNELPPYQPPEREPTSELSEVEMKRAARLRKHDDMRVVLECLGKRFGSQASLGRELNLAPYLLAQYNTGKARGASLSSQQLNAMRSNIDAALERKKLPRTPADAAPSGSGVASSPPHPNLLHPTPPHPPPPPPRRTFRFLCRLCFHFYRKLFRCTRHRAHQAAGATDCPVESARPDINAGSLQGIWQSGGAGARDGPWAADSR